MKKTLAILALIFSACFAANAQTGQVTFIPIIDPTNVTLFSNVPLGNFNTRQNYLMNIPANMASLILNIDGGSVQSSIAVYSFCAANLNDSTAAVANSFGTIIATSQGGSTGPFITVGIGGTVFSLAGRGQVIVGTAGCARLIVAFDSPTGTLTDPISAIGALSSLPFTVAGGLQNFIPSVTTPVGSSAIIGTQSGVPYSADASTTPLDAVSNSLTMKCELWSFSSATCLQTGVYPFRFNGTTWDRQFYCPNTSTFTAASTVTQVVAAAANTKIRVCFYSIDPSTNTAGSADLVTGTGANCATGLATLTGPYTFLAAQPAEVTITASPGNFGALTGPTSAAVCIRAVTSTVNGVITWAQY